MLSPDSKNTSRPSSRVTHALPQVTRMLLLVLGRSAKACFGASVKAPVRARRQASLDSKTGIDAI